MKNSIALCARCAEASMIVDLEPVTLAHSIDAPLCYFCEATAHFVVPAYHYHGTLDAQCSHLSQSHGILVSIAMQPSC